MGADGAPHASQAAADEPAGDASPNAPRRGVIGRLAGGGGNEPPPHVQPPASPFDADLEQPLLSPLDAEAYVDHVRDSSPKRWPQLRLSSVSTRRFSPWAAGGSSGDATLDSLLSPRPSGSGFSSPFTPSTAVPPLDGAPSVPPFRPAAPAHEGVGRPAPPKGAIVQPAGGRLSRAIVCGGINSVVALPIMAAFASIIFRVSTGAAAGAPATAARLDAHCVR